MVKRSERSSGCHLPQPLPKQGHPGCPESCPGSFWRSRRRDSNASLGNKCQQPITCTAQQCFLMFRWTLLCSALCPLPIALALGTTKNNMSPNSAPSLQAFMCIDEISPDPTPGWQSQLSQALLIREGAESLEEREESEFKSMKILILIRIEYISRKIKLWENPSMHLAASLEA